MSTNDAAAKGKKGKDKAAEKGEKGEKKKQKGKGGGGNQDDGSANKSKAVSVLDVAAMENAYNICHNVQDLLYFRGFFWEGSQKGKGKGKRGKKGKKGKG